MKAGSAARDISPKTSQFLCGYPHVPRMSEGIHDPLMSSALYLENGEVRVLFIANDILYVTKPLVARIRAAVAQATGMDPEAILISATHTHSGPKVVDSPLGRNDPVIPPTDPAYIELMVSGIIAAGVEAVRNAEPATLGFGIADSTGIGTNRHNPKGPSDHQVPLLAARSADGKRWIGWMYVCSMHPTVMHEESRLVSADFPWATRRTLQEKLLGCACPVLHHMGCAGNQSPRHVTRGNTFEEADRLGTLFGNAMLAVADRLVFHDQPVLRVTRRLVDPPRKSFPHVAEAESLLQQARQRFETLKRTGPATEARTAECDVFGAEHKLFLSKIVADGSLEAAYRACSPAEIQAIRVGDFCFAGWPSETYVDYALDVKAKARETFVISIANGTLHGYITTPEAAKAGLYESGAALFAPETGRLFVQTTLDLVRELRKA